MSDRVQIPVDSSKLVLARKEAGMRKSGISIGGNGEILPNGHNDAEYTVVVRPNTRSGPKEPSFRAIDLKACKGLKGCEFAQCAEKAMGKLPKHLQGLCTLSD